MVYYLNLFHGVFNLAVFALFVYEGSLGLKIRRARRKQVMPPPVSSIRRHRKNGPLFVILGLIGFLIGLALVMATSRGRVVLFPAHFYVGLVVLVLLIANYVVTRSIKRPVSPARTPHFALGVLMLATYVIQAVLGIRILF